MVVLVLVHVELRFFVQVVRLLDFGVVLVLVVAILERQARLKLVPILVLILDLLASLLFLLSLSSESIHHYC